MIQFYQQNSLKEYFKDLDTTLCTPYKQPEQSYSPDHTPHNAAHTAPDATPGTVHLRRYHDHDRV